MAHEDGCAGVLVVGVELLDRHHVGLMRGQHGLDVLGDLVEPFFQSRLAVRAEHPRLDQRLPQQLFLDEGIAAHL